MQIAGIGSICEQTPTQNNRRKQTIYRWNVRSNECKWIIEELYPHFIAKQLEARLVLGCPPSGEDAKKAHESLKAIHQGGPAIIDFPAPKSLYVPGWYLRSDVIWSKCNPMPESVTDRPTKSHEYIFLLTKKARYFYDADAIREPNTEATIQRANYNWCSPETKASNYQEPNGLNRDEKYPINPAGRNRRTVWEIATQPFPEAHFATFPEALVEPCIKAGTSERGCCPVCGAPWERVVESTRYARNELPKDHPNYRPNVYTGKYTVTKGEMGGDAGITESKTIGWQPTCKCGREDTVPCTVCDPFMGSGTTLKVARDLKRDAIGIEINPEYVKIARERLRLNEQLIGVI